MVDEAEHWLLWFFGLTGWTARRAQNEIAQLRRAAESRDREFRASHLIIEGLPEDSNDHSVFQAVSQLFSTPNGETPIAITEARRLGRPREGAPEMRPRAVLVKFTSVPSKHAALKQSKALRSRSIYSDNDLTLQKREICTQKRDRFQQLKVQNMRPF
ncbi:g1233 [Coccomyxa elongata]